MKNLAKSTIALIAAGLVIAALAGALIATALSGDDNDSDDDDRIALQTTESVPAGTTGGNAPVVDNDVPDADDVVPDSDDVVVDADDVPLGKGEADRVAKAALAAVGGGSINEISRSDDPGEAYEIEVLTDTGEVDIALDADLNRVSNNPYDD